MIDPLTTLMADALTSVRVLALGLLAQAEGDDLTLVEQIFRNPLVLPIGLFIIFYLTFLAPERRRKAEEAKKMAALKKNDRVITVGGIHGTVVSVAPDSDVVTVRIDENNNTRIKVSRSSIASIVKASQENNKESKDKTPEPDVKLS